MLAARADDRPGLVGDQQEAAVIGRLVGQGARSTCSNWLPLARFEAGLRGRLDGRLRRPGDQRQIELRVADRLRAVGHQRHGARREHHGEEDGDQDGNGFLQDRLDRFEPRIGGSGQKAGVAGHGCRCGIVYSRNRQNPSPRRPQATVVALAQRLRKIRLF
jgi:hypothetical protein